MPTETPNIRTRATSFFPGVRWVAVFVVLAAIGLCVSPRFSRGSQRAQDATLADCLRYLRTKTFLYAAQHNNIPPGFPGNDIMLAPDAQAFVEQMTQYTNAYGRPSRNREPGF